ncbi:MAG: GspE/PulE family protein [Candidatus Anammoxibacter sp.]
MPVSDKKPVKRLGQRLLESGLISEVQLDLALNESKTKGVYLGQALQDLGLLAQDVVTQFLADESGTDIVDVRKIAIDPEVIKLVPYDLARRHEFMPISLEDDEIKIAVADTLNVNAIDALEMETGLSVDVVTAPKNDILDIIEQYYSQQDSIEHIIKGVLDGAAGTFDEGSSDTMPIIRLVDSVIIKAINERSTDIHFQPDHKMMRVRNRIDGVLHQEVLIPKELQSAVIARLKIMANLDITETRVPMDGRIGFEIGNRKIDLRVSTLPTSDGETIVLRVLDKEKIVLDLGFLGYSPASKKLFEEVLRNPHGLILITGPTGSGKTSSLYAALKIVSTLEKNVMTLEDPIEYEMPLIRQTPVNPDVGMDFPTGLRAMLRQDPDIIMVGEIRDTETADLAIKAALTGHLVLSTLHTNSAAAAIPRLTDMGIKPYLASASLRAIVAQRLVRRICEHCKEEIKDIEEELTAIGFTLPLKPEYKFYKGAGCDKCSSTGYTGRIGLYEILKVDHSYHDLIVNNTGVKELEDFAITKGMCTMFKDGIDKALQGLTTLEQVFKITGE